LTLDVTYANVIRDRQVKADLERLAGDNRECELREPNQLSGRLDADLRQKELGTGQMSVQGATR
jgi:hypothetical protein